MLCCTFSLSCDVWLLQPGEIAKFSCPWIVTVASAPVPASTVHVLTTLQGMTWQPVLYVWNSMAVCVLVNTA